MFDTDVVSTVFRGRLPNTSSWPLGQGDGGEPQALPAPQYP